MTLSDNSDSAVPAWMLIRRDSIRGLWPGRGLGTRWLVSDLRMLGEDGIRQLYLADEITSAEFEAWIGKVIAS